MLLMTESMAALRREYQQGELLEQMASASPFIQFQNWFAEAVAAQIVEPNGMTVATATPTGHVSARIVLLKSFDENGFVFFTNYNSHKGQDLELNPHTALLFWWAELNRQVRIEGVAQQVTEAESDAYFASRPLGSQLGAWASVQSQAIASRQWLEQQLETIQTKFEHQPITRPPYWGGYRVVPQRFEFWQGRLDRLHDRLRYCLQADGLWQIERLSP